MTKSNQDIINFYNHEAIKYHHSRQKFRADGDIILQKIKKHNKRTISILEFGCGGGRLIKYLNENLKGVKINYTGVDFSEKLLALAQKDNPKNKFICDDILNYVKKIKPESFDFIIGIASFQHIKKHTERIYLISKFYKSLKYNGVLMMTNRSFSRRFIKKHIKAISNSIIKSIFFAQSRNDLYIPRKNGKHIYHRFYHIFKRKEIGNLLKEGGFNIDLLTYLDKNGHIETNWKRSCNTFIVGEKDIFHK